MTTPDSDLTTARLLAAARTAGFDVSETQLKRWRQRGLLPRPEQHHRAGLHGSVSVWPPDTERHVIALCDIATRFRKLDDLLLSLWWEGWPVDRGELLRELTSRLTGLAFGHVDRNLTEEHRLDAIEEMVAELDLARLSKPLRSLVHRVGKNDADRKSLLTALVSIAAGITPPVEAVDVGLDERSLEDLLATGLGFHGFAAQLTDVGDPTTSAELVSNVAEVADVLPEMLAHTRTVINRGDLHELCCARDQTRSLAKMADPAQLGILPSHDGIGHMARFMVPDGPDGWMVALMTVLWRRKTAPDELRALVTVVEEHAPLATVAAAVPELADLNRQAAADPDRLADLMQAHPEISDKINAFLTNQPDIARQLNALP